MIYPEYLKKIIDFYKLLPGIGEKNAERMALATINMDKDKISSISEDLISAKEKLKQCSICGHLTDSDKCYICNDNDRNKDLICVIEDYKSVFSFEKVGNYKGVYHVLGGLISPIDGINPTDINISSLVNRVKNNKNVEIILALKSSIEGETTSLYIQKILEQTNVKISRLSYGIPMGAEIEYLDVITLSKALEDRKEIR